MTTATPALTATTYLPYADHRTTLGADACQWFVAGIRRQARVAREAGVSLADASAALAWQEAADRDRNHWHTVDTVAEATGTYVESTHDRAEHTAGVHPVGDGSQPYAALAALACRTIMDVGVLAGDGFRVGTDGAVRPRVLWSHSMMLRYSRRGRRVAAGSVDGTNAAAAADANRKGVRAMTAAERNALARRRRAEAAAAATGTTPEAIEREREAWLADRAERGSADLLPALAEALAVAAAGWGTDH